MELVHFSGKGVWEAVEPSSIGHSPGSSASCTSTNLLPLLSQYSQQQLTARGGGLVSLFRMAVFKCTVCVTAMSLS